MKLASVLVLLALFAGCARGGGSDGRLHVVATVYPLEFVASSIGGARLDVTALTPAGAEPHDLELSPDQVGDLLEADLVLYVGGSFQPAVEDVLGEVRESLDVLSLVDPLSVEGVADPHVWLDPVRMTTVAEGVQEELARLDAQGSDRYADGSNELAEQLTRLDASFREALDGCERDTMFVSHAAFGYLTDRYDLNQVGIAGRDPEAEPSPRHVQEVAESARDAGATTIFAERLVSDRIAQTVAGEIDAQVETLDPLEGAPPRGNYFTAMEDNRDALVRGLGCT